MLPFLVGPGSGRILGRFARAGALLPHSSSGHSFTSCIIWWVLGKGPGPHAPGLSHLPLLPSRQVQQLRGPGMTQLTPLLSAEAVWVDWVVFWFRPAQLTHPGAVWHVSAGGGLSFLFQRLPLLFPGE